MKARGNDHYVPQFLLRHFAVEGSEQVFTFDLRTEKAFRANVRNVACESGFYGVPGHEDEAVVEKALSGLEGDTASIIQAIIHRGSIAHLLEEEKATLAIFVAMQMVRTRNQMENLRHVQQVLESRLSTGVGHSTDKERDEAARRSMVHSLGIAHDLAPHVMQKTWLLFRPAVGYSFVISDNPVTMHNRHRSTHRSTTGLAVRGIELYFPVSPQLTLACYCPSHALGWKKSLIEKEIAESLGLRIPEQLKSAQDQLLQACDALNTGSPIILTPQTSLFQNELQIWNAERFIFSQDGDFRLVLDTINRHPDVRRGRRLTVC